MGMIASIYDSPMGNCSNKGISARFKKVCITNVDGPFTPDAETPAVKLVKTRAGYVSIVPDEVADKWTMFGGAFVFTSDSRFSEAVQRMTGNVMFYGAVPLHDRVE